MEAIKLYLIPAFGDKPMRSITPADVRHWWDAFQPVTQRADRTKRRLQAYKILHAIMDSAARDPARPRVSLSLDEIHA